MSETPEITIISIDYAYPNCSTDVVHLVELSYGRTISIWSGQPAYFIYDDCTGELAVGARLVGSTKEEDRTVYHFEI